MPVNRNNHAIETDKARAQRNVRMLVERNRQGADLHPVLAASETIRSVGIVGAGLMGTAIAAVHVRRDLPVIITDADENVLDEAPGKIAAELAGEMPIAEARELVGRLVRPSKEETAVGECDLVLESIVERPAAKQRLYGRLARRPPGRTILASNTSTIPIGRLAQGLPDPQRFCGLHFFHPVGGRPLVEIVRGPQTSDLTVARLVAHAKAIDKMPIVVEDGPGFLVNRLLLPYLGEAMELLLEGAAIEAVEQAATEFGMAKGPLRLLDEIGLDTALQSGWVLAAAFPDRIVSSPLLVSMVKSGRLGCKSNAGFFSYADGPQHSDAERSEDLSAKSVERLIAQWARPPQRHTPQRHTPEQFTARLLLPMVLEAARILEEGRVRDPRDVDLGVLFGLGFPAFRGGLLWWADCLGAARIVEMLKPLHRLGPRVQPPALLQHMAASGGRFYDTAVRPPTAVVPTADHPLATGMPLDSGPAGGAPQGASHP